MVLLLNCIRAQFALIFKLTEINAIIFLNVKVVMLRTSKTKDRENICHRNVPLKYMEMW